MKTKNEWIEEARLANPKIVQTINGEKIEILGEEYEKTLSDWADMKIAQEIAEIEAAKEAEKTDAAKKAAEAKLAALGLTVADLQILGLGNA